MGEITIRQPQVLFPHGKSIKAEQKIGIDSLLRIVSDCVGTITPNILRPEKTAQNILHALLSLIGCAVCIPLCWFINCCIQNVQSFNDRGDS